MFNSEGGPKIVATRLEDISVTTDRNGSSTLGLRIGVGGNDEDLVKETINRMTSRAKEMGLDYEVGEKGKKHSGGKSFVSNWGSGSAWTHAKDN